MSSGNIVRFTALTAAAVAVTALGGSKANAETVFDLTGPVPQSTTINGAIFTTNVQQPTGTGVIDPFVRLETNQSIEKGFNTDFRPIEAGNDAKQDAQYTHSLKVADLQATGGYYQFLLDINQNNSGPGHQSLLNLNDLKVFVANSPTLNGYTGTGFSSGPSTLVYNMDGPLVTDDNGVLLDYNLNSGSGSGDLYVNIPTAGFSAGTYVYLYSSFGVPNPNNDGFEEWAAIAKQGTPLVPVPASVWGGLALMGLVGAAKFRSRHQSA